jgi:hypothetical protein
MANEYRGYRIKIAQTDRLTATIWAPRVLQSLSVRPTATLKEGEAVLLGRVKAAIDKAIREMLPADAEGEGPGVKFMKPK